MILHRNARTCPQSRRLLVGRVLVEGWSLAAAAEAAGVSERTAWKWVDRYRREGEAGLEDRPSTPKRVPSRTPAEREELILPDREAPVVLPVTSQALYLVQRLRDEAHRFAITYHRTLRDRKTVRSALDDLPGVGPKRKRELLKVFGSARRVREAPVEQIAAVPGIGHALAGRIKAHLEA